jgi:hypothetical protein
MEGEYESFGADDFEMVYPEESSENRLILIACMVIFFLTASLVAFRYVSN